MSGPDNLCLSGSQKVLDDVRSPDPLLVPCRQFLVADPGTIVAFDQSPDFPAAEPGLDGNVVDAMERGDCLLVLRRSLI